ncbi:Stress-related protein [Camellia lanceoleosa]|uniref:Stress-related protein n=1 Tax=Camellia lanceoleosa TaxID=1840588 RepID=A0ACC0F1P7_9ERIC|nr:Stress-related protein [Camellia lanceoleosa]
MVDTEAKQPTETMQDDEKRLKYLDIIQVATIYGIVCFSSLYEYTKENSGPLKSGVQTVEGIVKIVIGSVYEKFHDIPFELLKLMDRKVDYSINELDCHALSLIKQELSAAQKAPEVTRAVASEVQQTGVVDKVVNITKAVYTKYEPTAKELYVKYEPVREFTMAAYMPLVPIDRIVKVFEEAEHCTTVSTNGEAVPVT